MNAQDKLDFENWGRDVGLALREIKQRFFAPQQRLTLIATTGDPDETVIVNVPATDAEAALPSSEVALRLAADMLKFAKPSLETIKIVDPRRQ